MPRFVLLYHDCPPDYIRPSHWDLMFECGNALRTWALEELPRDWAPIVASTTHSAPDCRESAATNQVNAERLADHRRDYLEYEGPISGGRGNVSRVEQGTYQVHVESPDEWRIQVNGRRLCGEIALIRQAPKASDWQLTYQAASSTA